MDLFIIQLAKMTLVVLGIFFTPAITKKLVSQIQLSVAQDMLKWGGMAWAAASGGAALAVSRGKSLGNFASRVVKDETPSISHIGSRWLIPRVEAIGARAGRFQPAFKRAAGLMRGVDEKIQARHLIDQARKSGIPIPSKRELKAANKDPNARERVERTQKQLHAFLETRRPQWDPILGQKRDSYTPKPGRIVNTVSELKAFAEKGISIVGTGSRERSAEGFRLKPESSHREAHRDFRSGGDAPQKAGRSAAPRNSLVQRMSRVSSNKFASVQKILRRYKK